MRTRRFLALLTVLLLIPALATAGMNWKQETGGQRILKYYIDKVNENLLSLNEQPVNSLFECYRSFAVMGITDLADAEIPEEVEITAQLFGTSINSIVVRVGNPSRFAPIAASFLQAAAPETALKDQFAITTEKAKLFLQTPDDSFEEEVTELNGTSVYSYYAYYPDQYHDGVNWMQMTLVFPIEGYEPEEGSNITEGVVVTKGPDTYSGNNEDYEGYFSEDKFSHLEVFVQATPEPDSAAAEELNR